MNSISVALAWLAIYALALGLIVFALQRYRARLTRKYSRARRRSARSSVALRGDPRARRMLWFALLDDMYERYTALLEAARGARHGG